MTAIVTVFTADGFVIGADGRRSDSKTGEITDTAQKVFCFESDQIRLAYAWTGSTQAADGNGTVYDLIAAMQQSLPFAARLATAGFITFVSELCHRLENNVPVSMAGLPTDELARVVMIGYFQGQPFTIQIRVLYPASVLMVSSEEMHTSPQFHKSIFGAESVYPRYADRNPRTNAEAIDFVRQYLRDCVDSSNSDCVGIGGHIHIAELNPQGFKWVDPPKNSN